MKTVSLAVVFVVISLTLAGCATKKYVRQTVNERVAPLEGRTQELEETVRRNTQDIKELDDRLSRRIDEVSTRVDRAQATAEEARSKASLAEAKAIEAQQRIEDLRSNLDKYTLLTTTSVVFKLNSYTLTPEAKAQLDSLALEAKNHTGYLLEIQGFTDSTGNVKLNEQLSQNRAEAVQRYLAKEHQIPVYKMSIVGLGKLDESEASTRAERRAARERNRRVDVRLLVNNAVNPAK
ncbi:MAG: OmpA family protein [Acidobacteriota bacterium]|nr:OmpA family protein [Blastocatellia bacterium]MDW8412007.1 OmpA family protein [Acidobacteriota bacterium]